MPAENLKLKIQKGETFGRTLLFGTGPISTVTAAADYGAGVVKFTAVGHTHANGDQVILIVRNEARNISYVGSYAVSNVVAAVSFTVTAAWQGSAIGQVQKARDLTGYNLRAQVKDDYDSIAVALAITGTIPTPTNGVGYLAAASDVTGAAAATTSAIWAAELYDGSTPAIVEPLYYGDVEISEEGV
ncbi:MAG: hypothetical protein P1P81_04380 [Desulfobulbales bacterium]|nr:hypothetical protein [Desulfobulbales bacterium]